MTNEKINAEEKGDPNREFYEIAELALRDLFERAKATNELQFAMALMPEIRGAQDAGWSTAHESVEAFDEFGEHLRSIGTDKRVRVRIALAFYNHVSEGAGFYEIPKKLLLTIEGKGNNIIPFQDLVEQHRVTGENISPNSNRIFKDLIGHSTELGLEKLAETFAGAFDPDVRNAVAHADYIVWQNGLRIRRRNGGQPRVILWPEFDAIINRGLNLFNAIRTIAHEYIVSYETPKTIRSRLNEREPESDFTIYCDQKTRAFGFTTGKYPPEAPNS